MKKKTKSRPGPEPTGRPGEVEVPEEIHTAFEGLMNLLLESAMDELAETGYADPIGAILEPRGASVIRLRDDVDPDTMEPDALAESLVAHLKELVAGNPSIEATGVLMEVTVDPDEEILPGSVSVAKNEEGRIDAFGITLEHRKGDAHLVIAPLVLDSEGNIDIGAIWALPETPILFK